MTGDDGEVRSFYADRPGQGRVRNYSYSYNKSMYTSMWTAYPLYAATVGGTAAAKWISNPDWDAAVQIDAGSPYNVNVGSTGSEDYSKDKPYYARGHQIPDADRDNCADMLAQTYYWTNSTPQIHSGFNSGIWSSLEGAVRNAVPEGDTLYVVTGPVFNKVGESRTITYITVQNDLKPCPVPNYYWKALLKVKRSAGVVTDACAIGFWLEHRVYSSSDNEYYYNYVVSIDELERYTGFDLFVNLPDEKEKPAETNESWQAFLDF